MGFRRYAKRIRLGFTFRRLTYAENRSTETRACGYTMKCGRNKQEIVDYFNEAIKGVRRSKYDMNLNVFARQ